MSFGRNSRGSQADNSLFGFAEFGFIYIYHAINKFTLEVNKMITCVLSKYIFQIDEMTGNLDHVVFMVQQINGH